MFQNVSNEMLEAIDAAVKLAFAKVGLSGFRETSFFASNERVQNSSSKKAA